MQAWAPIIGSTIVAIATLIVLAFTVKQNQKTLDAARTRDYDEWRRNTLTSNTVRAVESGAQVVHELHSTLTRHGLSQEYMQIYHNAVGTMFSSAVVLKLMGADEVAKRCQRLATTSQRATAHMLLNWHEAKTTFSDPDEFPPALQRIYDFADAVRDASDELCAAFERECLPRPRSEPGHRSSLGSA